MNVFLAVGIVLYIWSDVKTVPELVYYGLGGYIVLTILRPYRWLKKIYEMPFIQETDVFSKVLHLIFVSPIEFLGRILWLTIDFLIIERTLLNWLARGMSLLTGIFDKLHTSALKNPVIFAIIGIGIMLYGYWRGK